MFKIGPPEKTSGTVWDDKGKSEIAEIYICVNKNRFKFIQFLYYDEGSTMSTSRKFGLPCEGGCSFFKTITLDYPSEYITGISGVYEDSYGSGYSRLTNLRSICFHTNKAKYGPFIAFPENTDKNQIEFSYQVDSKFYGFFGTYNEYGVESIGIYSQPMKQLPRTFSKRSLFLPA